MDKHSPAPWVHEYRSGTDPMNVSQDGWGSTGLWDGKGHLILGTDIGWEAGYQEPSNPVDKRILEKSVDMFQMLNELVDASSTADADRWTTENIESIEVLVRYIRNG